MVAVADEAAGAGAGAGAGAVGVEGIEEKQTFGSRDDSGWQRRRMERR